MEINELRVNGALLTHAFNKTVSIIGKVIKLDNNKIVLKTTDHVTVNVFTNKECNVGNMVEVVGFSTKDGISGSQINILDNELFEDVDENLYNNCLELAGKNPEFIQNDSI